MKLTEMLKAWLVKNSGVKADASDDEFRKAAGEALATGALSASVWAELTKDTDAESGSIFVEKMNSMASSLEKLTALLTQKAETPPAEKETPAEVKTAPVETKDATTEDKTAGDTIKAALSGSTGGTTPDVRVKAAHEMYSTTKSAMVYPAVNKRGMPHIRAGMPVTDMGRPIDHPSELDKAICGAYAKYCISVSQAKGSRTFGFQVLPQHDKELLKYAMDHYEWGGCSNAGVSGGMIGDINGFLNENQKAALIDDALSGGLEAAPIVFDARVIQTPLLNGELYPLVEEMILDRGRRVEGVAVSTVTSAWGGIDDTAITLFNTTSFVSEFNTTVYRWQGGITIGLDFMSDTPIDFGNIVTTQYGERLAADLDNVIAAGNGTTQPEGIINKAGTTSVTFGGSTSLGNYESLRFSVAKQEHRPNLAATAVFCGTETSYHRARAMPVGVSDARRLLGMNYDSYSIMERPYKINNSLSNQQIFYAILGGYRMYRRRGLTLRTSTEGETLIRGNNMLIVAMARYGGQLQRGGLAGKTTDAPA